MALIPYIAPGTPTSAALWNALYAEAERKLKIVWQNKAIVLWSSNYYHSTYYADYDPLLNQKKFIFFDGAMPAATELPNGSVWATWMGNYRRVGLSGTDVGAWLRNYDHTPFTTLAAGAVLGLVSGLDLRAQTNDDTLIARVDLGYQTDDGANTSTGWATGWQDTIYPDVSAEMLGNAPRTPALNLSLEAHKKTFTGKDYWLYDGNPLSGFNSGSSTHTFRDAMSFPLKWETAEIIIGDGSGDIDFPNNYNRFNFFRISNLRTSAVTVNFSTHHSVTIQPLRSQCVRRTAVAGTYTNGGDYFHTFLNGDPWFLNQPQAFYDGTEPTSANNLISPLVVTRLLPSEAVDLATGLPTPINNLLNPDTFKIITDLYGSKFGDPLSGSTPIGDLLIHKGDCALQDPAGSFPQKTESLVVDAAVAHLLTEQDNVTPARDIFNSVVGVPGVVQDPGGSAVTIPAMSGSDLNWTISQAAGSTYITFNPRTTGASPMLSLGDDVDVIFYYENRRTFTFNGMATAIADLAAAGITLSTPDVSNGEISISASPSVDLVTLTSNLAGVLSGGASNLGMLPLTSTPAILPPLIFFTTFAIVGIDFNIETTPHSVEYELWHDNGGGSGTVTDITDDGAATVDWDELTFATTYAYDPLDESTWPQHFTIFDTLSDIQTEIESYGGEMDTTASFSLTALGPVLKTVRTITPTYPGDFLQAGGSGLNLVLNDGNDFEEIRVVQIGKRDYEMPWPGIANVGLSYDSYAIQMPRLPRAYTAQRTVTLPLATSPQCPNPIGAATVNEPPFVKNFYENNPVGESVVQESPVLKANAISFLSDFSPGGNWAPQFSAWWRNESFIGVDYSTDGNSREAYYAAKRSEIVNNDENPNLTSLLPLEVDSYNAAASAINGTKATYQPINVTLDTIAGIGFNSVPNRNGFGLGRNNYRPREQFRGWITNDTEDTSEDVFWNSIGVTIYNLTDITDVTDLLDSPMLYYADPDADAVYGYYESVPAYVEMFSVVAAGTGYVVGDHLTVKGGWFSVVAIAEVLTVGGSGEVLTVNVYQAGSYRALPSNTTANPVTGGTGTGCTLQCVFPTEDVSGIKTGGLLDAFGSLEGITADDLINYRWVRIDEVKAYVEAQAQTFIDTELVVPVDLRILDGTLNIFKVPFLAAGTWTYARAYGFVNDSVDGEWCMDPDAYVLHGSNAVQSKVWVIRKETTPPDFYIAAPGSAVIQLTFGELDDRFYGFGIPGSADVVGVPPFRKSNHTFTYRRYGSLPAKAVVWARYSCEYTPIGDTLIGCLARQAIGNTAIPRFLDGAEEYFVIDLDMDENEIHSDDILTGELGIFQQPTQLT